MKVVRMKIWVVLLVAGVCFSLGNSAEGKERANLLGSDFSQWRGDTAAWFVAGDSIQDPANEKLLKSKAGSGVIINGPTGNTRNILSKAEFGDVRAHIEFMVPKGSNSGVYFQGRYEIQVFDSWGVAEPHYSDCGGIYERWDDNRNPQGFEGYEPRLNASKQPGQWQSFDVVFRAPRFDKNGKKIAKARFEKVVHNGVLIHADIELTGPTRSSTWNDEKALGPIMLQGDHGPVAYRNIRIEPAGPNPFFAMDTATKDAKRQNAKEQIEMVKELGYAGIGPQGGAGLPEMVKECRKNNLNLYAAYVGCDIGPDEKKYGPELTQAIEALKGTNSMLWLFVRSNKDKVSSPTGDDRAVAVIQEIADMAAKKQVRIALYPHVGFWVERVEDAVRVVKKVDRPNVGVTFNLCHWLKVDDEKNAESLIKLAMPYLFVVSINGADSGGDNWKTLIQTLDKGTYDVGGFLKLLADNGYTGPIGFQGYDIGGDAYDNLKRTMDAWRKLSKVMN
jgi:sugar phosphate isomerase/epimerase